MGQCGTMTGGRHRKGHKTRKTRKTRKLRKGGAGYGFNGAIGANGPEWAANSTSTPMKPDGTVDTKFAAADTATNSVVGGRRRKGKSKKGGKKSRRSRKMRGGMYPGSVNSAPVGAGFVGGLTGVSNGTYGTYAGYPQKVPAGNPHTVGADGVTKV